MGPGKVLFQDGKIIFVRHGMTYVRVSANRIVKKGCEFNQKKVCGERETAVDAEAAKTKAPIKKANSKVDPKPIIEVDDYIDDDGEEAANREEADNLEHLVEDQENEPFELDIQDEPLAVSQQEETLPSDRSIEEPTSLDVANNPSGEVGERQIGELDESTVVTKDGKRKRNNNHQEGGKRRVVANRTSVAVPRPQKIIFP